MPIASATLDHCTIGQIVQWSSAALAIGMALPRRLRDSIPAPGVGPVPRPHYTATYAAVAVLAAGLSLVTALVRP